ncbi:HNH endonuclease signature motif containing protein [Sinorhizobium medicae]|nr:HNH endonuclease signature motif containing protein [Sinorhizobium medicae]MBO1963706.1 HNH endonuclease [Sinorhizobium medicae]WQO53888.1 HNH endonuclease signature motif containing protein [Sinorhizobium medicae]WQP39786.1 HNH endonuclease signature motif containing protein [Sinorhizobium medicae]
MNEQRDQIREKIMARVMIDPVTGCWNWTGPTSGKTGRGKDYPRMWLSGQTVAVHLVMWTNEHGYIPGKRQLDHKCCNRLCVNTDPKHTELVTHKENQKRRDRARAAMIRHNGGPPLECAEVL